MPENKAKPLPISSSTPPQFAAEQREMFSHVLRLFNAEKIPYAVSGAFALHEHTGIWRDTKDLDLFLTEQDMPLAFAALQSEELAPKVYDPVWLSKAHRGDYFVDLITGMSNGVIRVRPDWIERAKVTDVFGVQAKVLAAEELIASKLFVTRRERFDGADLVHVIHGKGGDLDWTRLLELTGEHWMMLRAPAVSIHLPCASALCAARAVGQPARTVARGARSFQCASGVPGNTDRRKDVRHRRGGVGDGGPEPGVQKQEGRMSASAAPSEGRMQG